MWKTLTAMLLLLGAIICIIFAATTKNCLFVWITLLITIMSLILLLWHQVELDKKNKEMLKILGKLKF